MTDAERGRALVDRLFEQPRQHAESAEWEQALADLRAWSMAAWDRPASDDDRYREGWDAHVRGDDRCPYQPAGPPDAIADWTRGWSDAHNAAFDEMPHFKAARDEEIAGWERKLASDEDGG